MSAAEATTDHRVIREWVETRGGQPARVGSTGDGDVGVLRIDFPGRGEDEDLEAIDWQTFFDAFEDNRLAFLYQERTEGGQISRFNKLVSRDESD